jgi:hypothetical protein
MEFFNLELDHEPLHLVFVANVTVPQVDEWVGHRPCEIWMIWVFCIALTVGLSLSSLWLYQLCKVPAAGIVLDIVVVTLVLSHIQPVLLTIVGAIVVSATFAILRGVWSPTRMRSVFGLAVGREDLVWILYTTLWCLLTVRLNFLWALVGWACVGVLLEHPVLFLLGWVVGPMFVSAALFSFLVGSINTGLLLLCFGIVGGSGCITVSYFLHKHRAYLVYHLRRAWFRVTRSGPSVHRQL